jgi:hypothetical protein
MSDALKSMLLLSRPPPIFQTLPFRGKASPSTKHKEVQHQGEEFDTEPLLVKEECAVVKEEAAAVKAEEEGQSAGSKRTIQ